MSDIPRVGGRVGHRCSGKVKIDITWHDLCNVDSDSMYERVKVSRSSWSRPRLYYVFRDVLYERRKKTVIELYRLDHFKNLAAKRRTMMLKTV